MVYTVGIAAVLSVPGGQKAPDFRSSQRIRAQVSSDAHGGFERRVRERAYFLWLGEGRPEGRALEHWMLAFTREARSGVTTLRTICWRRLANG